MNQLLIPASGDYVSAAALFSDNGNGPPVDLTGYVVSVVPDAVAGFQQARG